MERQGKIMTNEQLLLIKNILLKQKKDLEDDFKVEFTDDESEMGSDEEEDASDEMDMAINSNIIDLREKQSKHYQKMINAINIALNKIENNTYGICEESGDEISFERLKANPTARYSLEIQQLMEEGKY